MGTNTNAISTLLNTNAISTLLNTNTGELTLLGQHLQAAYQYPQSRVACGGTTPQIWVDLATRGLIEPETHHHGGIMTASRTKKGASYWRMVKNACEKRSRPHG